MRSNTSRSRPPVVMTNQVMGRSSPDQLCGLSEGISSPQGEVFGLTATRGCDGTAKRTTLGPLRKIDDEPGVRPVVRIMCGQFPEVVLRGHRCSPQRSVFGVPNSIDFDDRLRERATFRTVRPVDHHPVEWTMLLIVFGFPASYPTFTGGHIRRSNVRNPSR